MDNFLSQITHIHSIPTHTPEISSPVGEFVIEQRAGMLVGAGAKVAGIRPHIFLHVGNDRSGSCCGRPGLQTEAGGGRSGQLVAPTDG